MKKFIKGTLETFVDDDDRRISEYLACGWKEAPMPVKPKDEADELFERALGDVLEADGAAGKKHRSASKKVNDAIKATTAAASESDVVDDGLFNKGGNA